MTDTDHKPYHPSPHPSTFRESAGRGALHQLLAFTDPPDSLSPSEIRASITEPLSTDATIDALSCFSYLRSIATLADVVVSNGLNVIDLSMNIQ